MTVYLVISLPKVPYVHRIYMVLANPINALIMHAEDLHFTSQSCACMCVYVSMCVPVSGAHILQLPSLTCNTRKCRRAYARCSKPLARHWCASVCALQITCGCHILQPPGIARPHTQIQKGVRTLFKTPGTSLMRICLCSLNNLPLPNPATSWHCTSTHTQMQKGVRTLFKTPGTSLMRNCSLPANVAHQFTIK